MEFWKGRQKGKTRKNDWIRRREGFSRQALWGNKRVKPLIKLQENSLFGPFYKTKEQKQKKNRQNQQTNTFLHVGKQPLVLVNSFFNLHPLFLQSCVEHSFCVSQRVKPHLETPSQNGTSAAKSAMVGFPKNRVSTKMRVFFTFRTQIVFAYFSKMSFWQERPFSSKSPKNAIFLFFWNVPFPFFHFLFCFIQHKNKNAHLFRKPFFDTLTNCPKLLSHPYTLFVIFKIPPKHFKIGGKGKTNLRPSFDPTLEQVLTQKPNLGTSFDSRAHIYIYIYMHACWRVIFCTPKSFRGLES